MRHPYQYPERLQFYHCLLHTSAWPGIGDASAALYSYWKYFYVMYITIYWSYTVNMMHSYIDIYELYSEWVCVCKIIGKFSFERICYYNNVLNVVFNKYHKWFKNLTSDFTASNSLHVQSLWYFPNPTLISVGRFWYTQRAAENQIKIE